MCNVLNDIPTLLFEFAFDSLNHIMLCFMLNLWGFMYIYLGWILIICNKSNVGRSCAFFLYQISLGKCFESKWYHAETNTSGKMLMSLTNEK